MIVQIESSLLNTSDNFNELKPLLYLCLYKRRYDVFIDLSIAQTSVFYTQLDSEDKLIIEQFYNRCIQENLSTDVIVGSTYTIDEAIRFLNQPLTIILENNNNDAFFFDKLLEEFKTKARNIRRLKDNGWLEYGNAGGCTNIPNFIYGKLRLFEGLPKENKLLYLRCFVLIDSDKKFPEDKNKERENLETYLKENRIPYHILEKREMENYLPVDAIPETSENREFIEAYKRLSPLQQDYFDIEKGYNKTKFEKLPSEIQEFYHDISPKDKDLFRKKGLIIEGGFKSNFPKFFESEKINRETLLARCLHQNTPHEIPIILEKITVLL